MANIVIESDLKSFIDADTWTVEVEGVTKSTYIWVESHSRSFNLSHIHQLTVNQAILVIHPSARQLLNQTAGSEVWSFQGFLQIYAKSVANMKSALTALRALANTDPHLLILPGGIGGDPKTSYYSTQCVYLWAKHNPYV